MKKFSVLIVALVLSIGFFACNGDSDEPDVTNPVVTITSPTAGQKIVAGTDLTITADFTDNEALGSWSYSVAIKTPAKKNVEIYKIENATGGEINGTAATGTETEKVDGLAQLGIYTLTVTVSDLSGNTSTASQDFEIVLE